MSEEIAAGAKLLSLTGLAGGVWACFQRENPNPLVVAAAVALLMVWTVSKAREEPSFKGNHRRWIVLGILGAAVLGASAIIGMPWPVAGAAVIEGGFFVFVLMMSGFAA